MLVIPSRAHRDTRYIRYRRARDWRQAAGRLTGPARHSESNQFASHCVLVTPPSARSRTDAYTHTAPRRVATAAEATMGFNAGSRRVGTLDDSGTSADRVGRLRRGVRDPKAVFRFLEKNLAATLGAHRSSGSRGFLGHNRQRENNRGWYPPQGERPLLLPS